MRLLCQIFSGLALLLNAAVANAETPQAENLTGLNSFNILVEGLPNAAAQCGITKVDLDTELRFVLGQSRIKLTTSLPAEGLISLAVNVLPNCVSSYDLEVLTNTTILKTGQSAPAAIWGNGGVRSGGNPKTDTLTAVDQMTKQLVNDWNSVNK